MPFCCAVKGHARRPPAKRRPGRQAPRAAPSTKGLRGPGRGGRVQARRPAGAKALTDFVNATAAGAGVRPGAAAVVLPAMGLAGQCVVGAGSGALRRPLDLITCAVSEGMLSYAATSGKSAGHLLQSAPHLSSLNAECPCKGHSCGRQPSCGRKAASSAPASPSLCSMKRRQAALCFQLLGISALPCI